MNSPPIQPSAHSGPVDILHLLFGGLGGHSAVVTDLAKECRERGLVSAACLYAPPSQFCPNLAEEMGVDVSASVSKNARFDLHGARAIGEVVRTLRPAAVLWHAHYAPLALARLRAQRVFRTLVMVEHQNMALRTVADHARSLSALSVSSSVVFLSEEDRARYPLRTFPAPSLARSEVIPNGVDMDRFPPKTQYASGNIEVRVGMMGRMVPSKDFSSLIRAIWLLGQSNQGPPLRLLIAGEGPERDSLEELVRDLGMRESVEFLGYLTAEEVVSYLRRLDIYAQISQGETVCTSILQAFSTGLPVIASRVGGIRELVSHDTNGILVPPSEPMAIAKALSTLASDEGKRARLGRTARSLVRGQYNSKLMADGYLAHLEGLDPGGPWSSARNAGKS